MIRYYSRLKRLSSVVFCIGIAHLSIAQSYFLNGDAIAIGDDCYQLTADQTNQNGTVWYADQLNLNEGFSLEFQMNYGDHDGADGMVFVLQTSGTSAIGEDGEGIGFSGFEPSLGIEFDTYQNSTLGDPPQDHLAISKNGNVDHNSTDNLAGPVVISAFSPDVEDGVYHIIKIIWDPIVQDLEVWVDCELRIITGVNLVNDVFNGENLVWWGFTAATGGETNNQLVCLQENILTVNEEVTICNGSSAELNAGGNPNGSFSWSPAAGLDNTSIQSPIASPTETTVYTVTYTDFCDNQQSDEVTVVVEDLAVTAENSALLTCYEPALSITSTNNFSNNVSYTWSTVEGNLVSGETSPTPTVDAAGIYSVEVNYQDECFAFDEIEVLADFTTFVAEAGNAPNIDCNSPAINLSGSSNTDFALFEWTTNDGFILEGETTFNPTITDGGTYYFSVLNTFNGCESIDSVAVNNIIEFPIADAGVNDTIACLSPFGFLDGRESAIGGEISYLWTNADGNIPESEQNLLTVLVNEPGTYYLTVTNNDNGCTSIDSVQIFFDSSALIDPEAIQFPNVFTPNNDSINDIFRPMIEGLNELDITNLLDDYELQIFNRWGNIVYESSGRVKFWDGKLSDGSALSPGVYYYTVRYTFVCGATKDDSRNGEVQIITSSGSNK